MPLFNTKQHPWVAKLKRRAPAPLKPAALDLFSKLAVHLSKLRTPPGNRHFRLPDDFCVNPSSLSMWGKTFVADICLDHVISGGQAVQASFMVEENGSGWAFLVHDPTIGVAKREWHDASDVAARSRTAILHYFQWFIAHLQSNHP